MPNGDGFAADPDARGKTVAGAPAPGSQSEISRRVFLGLLGSGVALGAVSCVRGDSLSTVTTTLSSTSLGADGPSTTVTPVRELSDVWAVWEEALLSLQTSPDHLSARVGRLVKAGDPRAIFDFVRDEIVVFPPQSDGFLNAVTETRWGMRGVLRSGVGTPREQADLLADLLNKAGLTAEVVQGRLDPAVDRRSLLRPNSIRPFAPEIDESRLDEWLRVVQFDGQPPRNIDPDGVNSREIADLIIATLPPGLSGPAFDWSLDSVPLVRVTLDGDDVLLNPLVPTAKFGEAYADAVTSAPTASAPPDIEAELQVSTTLHPQVRTTVASGSWPVDRLIGRQLVARFLPTGDPLAGLISPALQITTFTPTLTVDGLGMSPDDMAKDAVLGAGVTITGMVVRESADGRVTVDDEPLGASDGPIAADIATLEADVDGAAFPLIRLRVRPENQAGEPVLGLSGGEFVVEEDEVPVSFLLRQAAPPPPRVMLLFDTSNSLPDEFRGGGAAPFGRALAEQVRSAFPEALMRVAAVNYGVASASPAWISEPAEVEAETLRMIGDGSELWSALADAGSFGANVIVLVSDGQSTDPPETVAASRARVAVGPPVVVVGVGDVDTTTVDEMVATSRGGSFPVADSNGAVQAVLGFLKDRDIAPVHIEYQAMEAGPTTRTVRISASATEATAGYEVPPPAERISPPGLAGIYFVVRVRGRETIHTVAGVPADDASSDFVGTPEMASEVRAAFFGVTQLSVEASAPTVAAWLDDLFTSRLSLRHLESASDGPTGLLEAFENGVHRFTSELPALHAPMEGDLLTFETGPRLVITSRSPVAAGGTVRASDVLAQTAWVSVGGEPVESMAATVRNSLRVAAAEAALFEDSTISRLAGRSLSLLPVGAAAPRDGPYANHAKLLDRWSSHYRLIPTDGGPLAFWAVDPAGSVVGVFPDGAGKGTTIDTNATCKSINQGGAALDLLNGLGGLPFAYGAFFALQKAIMKQTLREAAIIASLGGAEPDTSECGSGPKDVLCDWGKDAVTEIFSPLKPISVIDKFVEASSGNGLISC